MSTPEKKAFVQQCQGDRDRPWDEKFWFSQACRDAAKGLKVLGYNVQGFDRESLSRLPLRKSTVVKGSIGTVRKALDLLGVPQPRNVDIPESLVQFTNREIKVTTLGRIRAKNERVFIKPYEFQKAFEGHMYHGGYERSFYRTSERYKDYATLKYPDSFKVLAAEPVNFEQEWRVYVLRGKILGAFGYHGNEDAMPTHLRRKVPAIVKAYKDAPAAYAIDLGIIEGRGLSLVEVNEGFSLGNYGLPKPTYAQMVEARWYEMVGL